MSVIKTFVLFSVVVILAAASRLMDHPMNFTPIGAMALFAGAYGLKKYWVVLPLFALFLGDWIIGFYSWQVMAAVYGSFALSFAIGWQIRRRIKWQNVALASLLSALSFFVITNFAVWAFFPWYPRTLAGLLECYAMAIPFFRNTLMGDLFYAGALFGGYALAAKALLLLAKEKVGAR